jgi:hypothetical protein
MSNPPIKQKYIKTPEDLLQAWEDYKKSVDSNPDVQQIATAKGVQDVRVKKPYQRKGFETYFYKIFGHHVKQYIDNYEDAYESYLGVVTHMRNEWESDQIEGSLTGRYKAPNLVARLNGLVDKKETEIKGVPPIFPDID